MSSSPVSGMIRCKGISKSSEEQCRRTQYESQYCWVHKDQTDLPSSKNHAAALNYIGLIYVAISASNHKLFFYRPKILLLLAFLASIWLTGSTPQLSFSAPEYRGPVRVCTHPEPSLELFNQHHPSTDRSVFPTWLTPFKPRQIEPLFEPASLVNHIINATIPSAGAGSPNLTTPQKRGLSIWQNCSKSKISSTFDLQCPFDAFNHLFFGGLLSPVKIGWTEPPTLNTTLAEKKKQKGPRDVTYGITRYKITPQSRPRHVNITILSRESDIWHLPDSPTVYGVLLHEMAHAYFALYACSNARVWAILTPNADMSELYAYLSNLGTSGHGPEWLRLTRALEGAASEYLGLGEVDLSWRWSVYEELLNVKRWRERVVGIRRFEIEEVDKYFGEVISDIDALLGLRA